MSAVIVLTREQYRADMEEAAELGAKKALAAVNSSMNELTSEQVAAALGLKTRTVSRLAKAGRLKWTRRHGKEYRFVQADIDAYKRGGPMAEAAQKTLASLPLDRAR
jgi:excisionase family DNA binding protein